MGPSLSQLTLAGSDWRGFGPTGPLHVSAGRLSSMSKALSRSGMIFTLRIDQAVRSDRGPRKTPG